MINPIKFLLTLFLFACMSGLKAQSGTDVIFLSGDVKDDSTNKKLPEFTIRVIQNNNDSVEATIQTGHFEVELNYDSQYLVKYLALGYVTKSVLIDARNVPTERRFGGQGFDFDVMLFKPKNGCDVSLFERPIGVAAWDESSKKVDFDRSYVLEFIEKYKKVKECVGYSSEK